jgi:ribosomal protein S18 acetylase RimI-like enzyme
MMSDDSFIFSLPLVRLIVLIYPSAMIDSIHIRCFQPADLPVLRQITVESFRSVALEQLLEEKYGRWNERGWKARKADHMDDDCAANPSGVFIAERDGVILGYITTRVDRHNSRGRIPNLAVIEEARGLGLGRRLIEHALNYFRAEGMHVAVIETLATNEVGQHLYPSCGFEEVARQIHYATKL